MNCPWFVKFATQMRALSLMKFRLQAWTARFRNNVQTWPVATAATARHYWRMIQHQSTSIRISWAFLGRFASKRVLSEIWPCHPPSPSASPNCSIHVFTPWCFLLSMVGVLVHLSTKTLGHLFSVCCLIGDLRESDLENHYQKNTYKSSNFQWFSWMDSNFQWTIQ